jgi:hypothetical protein
MLSTDLAKGRKDLRPNTQVVESVGSAPVSGSRHSRGRAKPVLGRAVGGRPSLRLFGKRTTAPAADRRIRTRQRAFRRIVAPCGWVSSSRDLETLAQDIGPPAAKFELAERREEERISGKAIAGGDRPDHFEPAFGPSKCAPAMARLSAATAEGRVVINLS